jgi:hypothetical protein
MIRVARGCVRKSLGSTSVTVTFLNSFPANPTCARAQYLALAFGMARKATGSLTLGLTPGTDNCISRFPCSSGFWSRKLASTNVARCAGLSKQEAGYGYHLRYSACESGNSIFPSQNGKVSTLIQVIAIKLGNCKILLVYV